MMRVRERYKANYYQMNEDNIKNSEVDQILLRLKLFGIFSIHEEKNQLIHKYKIELNLFYDEIKNAYQNDEILQNRCLEETFNTNLYKN